MNKRAETGGLTGVVVFSILAVIVIIIVASFIGSKGNSAEFYEEFYAREIASLIDIAEKGSEIYIDVTPATVVAQKNGINLRDESIFRFDNEENLIIVKLRNNGYTEFHYFSDKIISDPELEILEGLEEGVNRMHFFVK